MTLFLLIISIVCAVLMVLFLILFSIADIWRKSDEQDP